MTVLVTGATGCTGGRLVRELLTRGEDVRALVRCDPSSPRASALASLGVDIVQGDIRDAEAVDAAARDCELIYHIAAVFRSAGHADSLYDEVNVGGTANVLAAAKRYGAARLVHCSTVGVHGHVSRAHIPAGEDAPFNPGDAYQRSKLEGERLVQSAIEEGVPATIFRPGGVYGPGDMRFFKLFRSINSGTFRMFGTGEALYHLTYIDDLIQGIVRCGTCERAAGQTYILAGPGYTTLNELVAHIASALGVAAPAGRLPFWPLWLAATVCEFACVPLGIEPPLHRRRADFFRKDRAFSIEKARLELGFEPAVDLPAGLAATAAWYVRQGLLEPRSRSANNGLLEEATGEAIVQ